MLWVNSSSLMGMAADEVDLATGAATPLAPKLGAKGNVRVGPDGTPQLNNMGAAQLVEGTRRGFGKETPADQRQADPVILDIFGNTASVRATMREWIDYMHMARWNGRWVIVNVLWEMKPKD